MKFGSKKAAFAFSASPTTGNNIPATHEKKNWMSIGTKMKELAAVISAAAFVLISAASGSQATTLDFNTMSSGSVSRIGDVTFALVGTGATGDPYIQSGQLRNSPTGHYPTNTALAATFDAPVSGVSFDFNPHGFNSRGIGLFQGWTLFDAVNSVIGSGTFSSSSLASYDLTAFSGIARIEWSNGGNNWYQSLEKLTYGNAPSAVPVPASLPLLLAGFCGLGYMARRKRKSA